MQYRTNEKNGDKLSALGMGCMRFPKTTTGAVDIIKAKELVKLAIDSGINYFDVAYIYRGCEEALGIALEGYREKVKIATKLPLLNIKKYEDFDAIFEAQLKSLRTTYIDYYLMHMLSSMQLWENLKKIGIERWIEEKKKQGKIKNIGFSFHGSRNEFLKLVEAYPWEFVMVQYNYVDENTQASRQGVELCESKGIPVFIMEPLRGGYLTYKLPKKAKKIVQNSGKTAADIALRWLWNQNAIKMVLSGMTTKEQILENVQTAEDALVGNFLDGDNRIIEKIKSEINRKMIVSCTGCGYCMPCPFGVNIPGCFSSRNDRANGFVLGFKQYVLSCGMASNNHAGASKCKGCGICEKHCPQNIKIKDSIKEVKHKLEPFWFRWAMPLVRKFISKKQK